MERLNENKIICHIVGLNQEDKIKLKNLCNKIKKYNIIDLDVIYNDILNDEEMSKMFKSYSRLKKNKNDKFKDVDKKMTKYWEDNMIKKVYDLIPSKKKCILVGKNHHYRLLSKKVNFLISNKFILDNNIKEQVRENIKNNLTNHQSEILNGTFPIEFLDYRQEYKKRMNFEESYLKSGYTKMKLEQIINILEMHSKNKIPGKGLWFSSNEPYNIGSKIHPNKSPIYAFNDPVLSLVDSFNINEEGIELSNAGEKVISLKGLDSKKMNKGRYIYYVSKEDFIPCDANNEFKYFTQNSVTVLEKEKISNVYKKLEELKLINQEVS